MANSRFWHQKIRPRGKKSGIFCRQKLIKRRLVDPAGATNWCVLSPGGRKMAGQIPFLHPILTENPPFGPAQYWPIGQLSYGKFAFLAPKNPSEWQKGRKFLSPKADKTAFGRPRGGYKLVRARPRGSQNGRATSKIQINVSNFLHAVTPSLCWGPIAVLG